MRKHRARNDPKSAFRLRLEKRKPNLQLFFSNIEKKSNGVPFELFPNARGYEPPNSYLESAMWKSLKSVCLITEVQ